MEFKTKESVHKRALEAVGKSFNEIDSTGKLKTGKGGIGTAIEEGWFGMKANSRSEADFFTAGVELKTTPYKILKNGEISAKERLVLNIINYMEEYKNSFEKSSFMKKNNLIELMFYEYIEGVPKLNLKISKAILFSFPSKDLEIIKNDWETIISYIKNGKAHELTEGATNILAACTKGKNSKSMRAQPFSSEKAKQRAYSLKSSYMTYLLRNYIFGEKKDESIISEEYLENTSLEKYIEKKVSVFIGKSQQELCIKFNIKPSSNGKYSYQSNYILAGKMLDLKGDIEKSEEIQKSGIQIKAIRIKGKTIKENISFPTFKFAEISKQRWEDSELKNFFEASRFLFFIFQYSGSTENPNELIFKGIKFWNMKETDIEGDVKTVWNDTVNKINEGVKLNYNEKRNQIENNFIGQSGKKEIAKKNRKSMIIHVRPHATESGYVEESPYSDYLPQEINWKNKPLDRRVSNHYMTSQSFWLNKKYVYEQIVDILK